MTVRRDVEGLAARGSMSRIRGGAISRETHEHDSGASPEVSRRVSAIVELAASHVRPSTTVGITHGQFAGPLAAAIGHIANVKVVTNSLIVLGLMPAGRVILVPGMVGTDGAVTGPLALGSLEWLHVDTLFVSLAGLHPVVGATADSIEAAEFDRTFMNSAAFTVMLVPSNAWMASAIGRICRTQGVNRLITDDEVGELEREKIASFVGVTDFATVSSVRSKGSARRR